MKTASKIVLSSAGFALLLAGISAGLRAESGNGPSVPRQVGRELALESKYERLAAMEDALIAAETREKRENWRQYQFRKLPPPLDIAEKDREISAKIAEAQDKKAEYLKLAEWHKYRASDLQEEI